MRNCMGMTYLIDDYGNERRMLSLNREEIKALNEIDYIKSWNIFESKFIYLKNAIRAKSDGEKNLNLMNKINNLKIFF